MKAVRRKCDSWLLCSVVCLLCLTSVAAIGLGVFNVINTMDAGSTRESLSSRVGKLSLKAQEVESEVNSSMVTFESDLRVIEARLNELSRRYATDAPELPDETADPNNINVTSSADVDFTPPSAAPTLPENFVNVPVRTGCKTRTRECPVSGLQLLGNSSSVRFSQCSTRKSSFSEPGMYLTNALCYIDGGNQSSATSSLHYGEGEWSCECYGLTTSTLFTDFSCKIEVSLCPLHLNITRSMPSSQL